MLFVNVMIQVWNVFVKCYISISCYLHLNLSNSRDTGILGRMTDVLGKSMSTSRIAIDGSSNNLFGDPAIGLEVDVIAARGPDQFYVNDTFSLRQVIDQLNNQTIEGSSSIHADLWSQSLIDSKDKSDRYVSLLDTVSDSSIDLSLLGKQLNMVYKLIKLSKFKYS